MSANLKDYLKSRQKLVDTRLAQYVDGPDFPPPLREAMRYSLLAPGKRLRPVLVLMACQAAGGEEEKALPAACAAEMVHTYSLIHDDLPAMDDDDLRRGLPTCHKKFGEALAILAGDGLLTLAFQVIVEHLPPLVAAGCVRELAWGAGAAGMVGGQVEDLAWESITQPRRGVSNANPAGLPAPTLETLEKIHLGKTGALFRACLRMGAWVAQGEEFDGPDKNVLENLDGFGRCFGLVFQITDDLIDVEGNAKDTGKRTQKDAQRGKLTYPGLLGIDESRRRAQALVETSRGCLERLGPKSARLADLLQFVLARDR